MAYRYLCISLALVAATLHAAITSACTPANGAKPVFAHPGMLHTATDLLRVKTQVAEGHEPWKAAYALLSKNPHAAVSWKPRPQTIVYRGKDKANNTENYGTLYKDAASAYALALQWHITGEEKYAAQGVTILNAWASTLQSVQGTSDKYLASGLYGYQLANAAELLRGYAKWDCKDFDAVVAMMLKVFYPMNHDFLVNHNGWNGARVSHYWANWDLANMASMISIGVLADRKDIFDEAVDYFKNGEGNGAITKTVWKLYPDGTGQVQESGRDQAHTVLVISLLGVICQTAFNQGEDLFAYDNNRVLAGAEYVAKYNLGYDVEFTTYQNIDVTQTVVSNVSRGEIRPSWELMYNHYVVKKKLSAPFTQQFAAKVRPEGGGGNYGPNSNGYDQFGHGTLMYTLESEDSPSPSPSSTTIPTPTSQPLTPSPDTTVPSTDSPSTSPPVATPTPTTEAPAKDSDGPGKHCNVKAKTDPVADTR